jgi:hypothetical protein
MTPWTNHKYLHMINDYNNFEFYSSVNVWNPQAQYQNDFQNVKFIDIDIIPGSIIYIPSYWLYSIKFLESNTLLTTFTYNSIINCVSNIKHYLLYYFQYYNTTNKLLKPITSDSIITENNNINDLCDKKEDTDTIEIKNENENENENQDGI